MPDGAGHRTFKTEDASDRHGGLGARIERILLAMRFHTRRIDKGEALGNDAPHTRGSRGVHQIACPLDANPRIAREHLRHLRRIDRVRQIGKLVDDHIGLSRLHRRRERRRIEHVDYGGFGPQSLQHFLSCLPTASCR